MHTDTHENALSKHIVFGLYDVTYLFIIFILLMDINEQFGFFWSGYKTNENVSLTTKGELNSLKLHFLTDSSPLALCDWQDRHEFCQQHIVGFKSWGDRKLQCSNRQLQISVTHN